MSPSEPSPRLLAGTPLAHTVLANSVLANSVLANTVLGRRTVLSGLLAGGGLLALAACADTAGTGTATSVATTTPSAGPISIVDNRGTTITFEQPVTSIVTIPMPAASLLVAVDQSAKHLSAMHTASWSAMQSGILGEMFPDALTIPHDIATTDFTPNVESILALNPDVVVQWSDSNLTAPLENAGLTVIGLTNHGTQDDVDSWAALFAAILGKPERAVAMKARSDTVLARVKAQAAKRSQAGPSILYFNRFTDGLKVAATNSYNDFYIKLIGGSNPATGPTGVAGTGMVGVDVEQVLAWDPEVILLGNFDAALPNDLYANPVWAASSAVKNRRVYRVPLGGYRWDPPGQESPLMWQWLADIAFPDKSSKVRDQIDSDYPFLYDHNPTAVQIDTILRLDVNDQSANYQQFHA